MLIFMFFSKTLFLQAAINDVLRSIFFFDHPSLVGNNHFQTILVCSEIFRNISDAVSICSILVQFLLIVLSDNFFGIYAIFNSILKYKSFPFIFTVLKKLVVTKSS